MNLFYDHRAQQVRHTIIHLNQSAHAFARPWPTILFCEQTKVNFESN